MIVVVILLILISTYFGIINGHLDAWMIIGRNKYVNPVTLKHNTRLAIRGVFYFLLSLLAYIGWHLDVWAFILLFVCSGMSFYLPFTLSINKVRRKPWWHLGSGKDASKLDIFLRKNFKKKGVLVASIAAYALTLASALVLIMYY